MDKSAVLVVRVEKEDIKKFKAATEKQDKTMAKVLRNFIKKYIQEFKDEK